MLAVIVGLVVLAVTVAIVVPLVVNRVPLLAPPGPAARLTVYLSSNVARVAPDSRFAELRSPRFAAAPRELAAEVAEAARRLGFGQIAIDPTGTRVTAVVTTPLLGFRDDIEVVAQPQGTGSVLLARSASRVGRGDLGTNQKHLRSLLDALAERLQPRPASP